MLYVIEEMVPTEPLAEQYQNQTYSELVFFEMSNGGAVFSVGSMACCGSLSHNNYQNSVSTITENVIRRFCDDEAFQAPGELDYLQDSLA